MDLVTVTLTGEFIMDWRDHIETNKKVLAGQPAIKGTRLSVAFILELMGAGSNEAAVLTSYPQLTPADLQACLRCASESMGNKSSIDDWILGDEHD